MAMSERLLKTKVAALLQGGDLVRILAELQGYPGRRIINPLLGHLCSCRELEKWYAVSAIGAVVASLAETDLEAARVVMRRLMWTLNDESGGIGWGAPEALAECMADHPTLATEYTHILITYMREDGNFLELEPLQRGVVWGIGRLAQVHPDLLRARGAIPYLLPYLDSKDGAVRGAAAWAAGLLQAEEGRAALNRLLDDPNKLMLYDEQLLQGVRVAELASQALERLAEK